MIDHNDNLNTIPPLEEIYAEFDFLGDSDDQINYLIDLGLDLPKLSPEKKTEQNRVHGCQSQVWMTTEFDSEHSQLNLQAESDAMIVNGLIVVLMAAYQQKTPQQILELDIHAIFDRLGMDRHLSPQRKNGLNGMVQRIRSAAQQALNL